MPREELMAALSAIGSPIQVASFSDRESIVNTGKKLGVRYLFYGSLENGSLKTIINSDKAKGFRDRVRKGKFESFLCFRCCHRQYY